MKLTKDTKTSLQNIIGHFESAKDSLVTALEALRDEWQGQFDEKSEKWQEGDAGTAASERIQTLETMISDLENVELPDLSELEG